MTRPERDRCLPECVRAYFFLNNSLAVGLANGIPSPDFSEFPRPPMILIV